MRWRSFADLYPPAWSGQIAYGKLWQEFEPLAVYSPDMDVSYERLAELGAALRKWYFQQGGLLLADRARNAYFLVQDAIGSIEQQTNTPAVVRPRAKQWTRRTLDRAREQLRLASLPAAQARPVEHAAWENRLSATIDGWRFGEVPDDDFVLLQYLASSLRTRLARDLHPTPPTAAPATVPPLVVADSRRSRARRR